MGPPQDWLDLAASSFIAPFWQDFYAPLLTALRYGVVGLAYLGLALGHLPGLRLNRANLALVAPVLLIGLGVLDLRTAWRSLDHETLVFLFSMMLVNANLAAAGFFPLVLSALLRWVHSPLGLIVAITGLSGGLSALFLNDTVALVMTPLVVGLAQTLGLNPLPYLLALAGGCNLGSVATLSGNPQNILIGSLSGIGYVDFAQALIPLALVGLSVQVGLLALLYPEVRSLQPLSQLALPRYRVIRPLLFKSWLIGAGLLIAFVCGAPLAESSLIAAAIVVLSRRLKPERWLAQVDWDLLVLFGGLFVLTKAVQLLGPLKHLAQQVQTPGQLLALTVLLSNLISNVPAVMLIQELLPEPVPERIWLLVAAGSTLAGNLTLLGSVANLIVAQSAVKQGQSLSFWEHLRFGLPLTIITLGVTYLWLR
jgi:Na+/H+ antiporter NhaD/arsenite permease-like protein